MNELFEALKPSLLTLLTLVITTLVSYMTIKAKEFLVLKTGEVNAAQIRITIDYVVKCVEQIGKTWGSEEKLEEAKRRALAILAEKGLTVTETELNTLIEATVNAFYGKWKGDPVGEPEPLPMPVPKDPIVEDKEGNGGLMYPDEVK